MNQNFGPSLHMPFRSRSPQVAQNRASLSVPLSATRKFIPSLHAPTATLLAPVEIEPSLTRRLLTRSASWCAGHID